MIPPVATHTPRPPKKRHTRPTPHPTPAPPCSQNITALTAQQQQPIVSLIPPMETQELALTYLQSGLGSCSIL